VTVAGGLFFPQSKSLRIDPVEFSPALQQTITYAAVAARSFQQASELLDQIGGLDVDPKQVERLTRAVGEERLAERDTATAAWRDLPVTQKFGLPRGVAAPDLAVVMCDGGRLQLLDRNVASPRAEPIARPPQAEPPGPGSEPSVTPSPTPTATTSSSGAQDAEAFDEEVVKRGHWREDKLGLLLTMQSEPHATDPCPTLPDCFLDEARIGELVRQLGPCARRAEDTEPGAFAVASASDAQEADRDAEACVVVYEPPTVATRQVVGSCRPWKSFAPILAAAAWSLGLMDAARKAFVGDGAANNWRLHKKFFSSFVAVLDFIHALSYVYAAAMAGRRQAEGWAAYRRWIAWVWEGRVAVVIEELAARQAELGRPEEGEAETSPRQVVSKALGYLGNHQEKMRYAEYRRAGLPITSSLMESAVKQMNQRVKGTEKFWSSSGGEAMVQLRADQLSDGDVLEGFWQRRQAAATGQRHYRRRAG
jgi:hypothetical protein